MKKKDFKPHTMYNPKTGEGTKAATYEQHLKLKKMGYGHSKPAKKKSAKKKTAKKKSKTSFTDAVAKRMGGGY
tara:strand:+ start:701 stop:919 length:219 start_codon:yes stop_codon:yes gene_type:complete